MSWTAIWWIPFPSEWFPFSCRAVPQLWDSYCSLLLLSYSEIEKCAFCTSVFAWLLAAACAVKTSYSFFLLFSFTSISKMLWDADILNCLCSSAFKVHIVKSTMSLLASLFSLGYSSIWISGIHKLPATHQSSSYIQNSFHSHFGRY